MHFFQKVLNGNIRHTHDVLVQYNVGEKLTLPLVFAAIRLRGFKRGHSDPHKPSRYPLSIGGLKMECDRNSGGCAGAGQPSIHAERGVVNIRHLILIAGVPRSIMSELSIADWTAARWG